jgi:hypothetical protein
VNYKVVDLVESYNFHIKFTSIRVQTKNYKFLKTDWSSTTVAHDGSSRYSTTCVATAVRHGDSSLPSPTVLDVSCIVLQFIGRGIYFAKLRGEM